MLSKTFLKTHLRFIVLVLLTILATLLSFFQPFTKLNYRLYDFMLGKSKEIAENPDIVFLDIDDDSIANIGTWPWTRDILGDALIRMKEFGAIQAVFDIEYISPATNAVESDLAERINGSFIEGQQAISDSVMDYAEKIERGGISAGNAVSEAENLVGEISNGVLYEMQRDITSSFNRDNDDYFARAVQFFGRTSLTLNMRDIGIQRETEEIQYARNRFLFGNVSDTDGFFERDNDFAVKEEGGEAGFVPAIQKIISRAESAGFTNVVIDEDGVRRRVELFHFYEGKHAGQLAFAPLMLRCDAQSFERKKNSLIVKGMLLPGETERCDITIPLDAHGRMLVNWLHKDYGGSFAHLPVYLLYNLDRAEELIVSQIERLCKADLSALSADDAEYVGNIGYFAEEYAALSKQKQRLLLKCRGFDAEGNAIRGGISDDDCSAYFERRKAFFSDLKDFTDSFSTVANAEAVALIPQMAENVELYSRDCELLSRHLSGAFVLVGNSASSSTDLGTTPFANHYANVGTHGNVINTIINRDFITERPVMWGIALCFAIALAIMLLTSRLSLAKQNILGILYVIIPAAAFFILMVRFKIYIPPVLPLLFVAVLSYVFEVILNFRAINGQKKFLQAKMGAYVSPEVVKEMQKNPKLAELGAQNKYMTALFSDVAKFSGFTETLNNALGEEKGAVELQQILSDYLGYLTKAIMGQQGTVDKFVGDEIVSFFNAPLDDENHAFHACVAGIRMLQAEAQYNESHKDTLPINKDTGKPFLLHSRVGLNTGYMAVGNMGTAEKMNYTVMGNAVNLASRLEGTNKVYGSWIMCSDSTWQAADAGENKGKLVARKFDCVRVINVKKPVQIHNILGLRDEMPAEQIEAAEIFNKGMDWYLKGSDTPSVPKSADDLKRAYAFFKKAGELYPADASSRFFMKRCEDFVRNGIPAVWDGVFTMTQK